MYTASQHLLEKTHGSVVHRYADDVVELAERTTKQRMKQVTRPDVEATMTQKTDALATSTAPPTSASATSNNELPFEVSYDMHEMLIQLLLLFTQYLPPFYAMHWEAANPPQPPSSTSSSAAYTKRTRLPVPLPPGTDVDSFQAWFRRADTLAQLVLANRADMQKQHPSDSEMLYLLTFHLRVQTMYHAPAVITNVDAFWTQVNQLLNDPDARFTACLRDEYSDAIELLSTLTTLIVVTNDHARLATFSERLLTIWLVDPLPTTSGTPHDKSFHVYHFSPSLATHECIQTILSMCVEGMLNMQRREEKDKTASDVSIHSGLPVGQAEKQIVRLIELTGVGANSNAHPSSLPLIDLSRSTLNLHALIGILHGTRLFLGQFDASSTFRSTDTQRPTFPIEAVQTNGVHKLFYHLTNLLITLPEIQVFVSNSRSNWPCSDGPIYSATSSDSHTQRSHQEQDIVISQSCPSCQFLLIFTTVLTHSTVWFNTSSRLRNGFDDLLAKDEAGRKSICAVMMQMVTRVALHLMDTTWIFNECFRDTDATPDKLSEWFASPYFRLLPHYRKAMERLFFLLDANQEEYSVVNLIWRRVKYMHHVWRWWYVLGAQMSKPSSGGVGTRKWQMDNGDTTEKRALARLKQVSMMQPTNNSVQLGDSSSASTSTTTSTFTAPTPSSLTFRPLLLRPTLLARAQRSLSLLTMFFAKILQHEKWIYSRTSEAVNTPNSSSEFKSHITTICQIIDTTADLEFIFASNQLAPPETHFQPHQQLVKAITALVNGQEIQKSGESSTVAAASPPISTEARQRFGECLVNQYICWFLRPAWKWASDPSATRILLPFDLRKEFDFEQASKNGFNSTSKLFRRTFAPHILSHDIFICPYPSSDTFPIPYASDNTWQFGQESAIMRDTPYTQRIMFLTKYVFLESVLEKIPWRVQYHVLLRWTWMHTCTKSVMMKEFQQNVVQLCMRIIENGFVVATPGNKEEVLSEAWSSAIDLSSPTPLQLETFLRTLLPHLVTHVTMHYPSSTSFTCLCHVYLRIFGGKVMMQNDPMLLVFMKQLYERIVQMTEVTVRNKEKMKEWRKVLKHDGSPTTSDSDNPFLPIPPHLTSLPDQFPQFVPIRRLLMLYMQLIQYLDIPTLFPHALTYLDTFFRDVMNPQKDPLYTPIRASFAHLLYVALSGRFNLTKRDVMMKWLMQLVEELNIPVGIKEIVVAGKDGNEDGQSASDGETNDSTSKLRRNLAALKKVVENR